MTPETVELVQRVSAAGTVLIGAALMIFLMTWIWKD